MSDRDGTSIEQDDDPAHKRRKMEPPETTMPSPSSEELNEKKMEEAKKFEIVYEKQQTWSVLGEGSDGIPSEGDPVTRLTVQLEAAVHRENELRIDLSMSKDSFEAMKKERDALKRMLDEEQANVKRLSKNRDDWRGKAEYEKKKNLHLSNVVDDNHADLKRLRKEKEEWHQTGKKKAEKGDGSCDTEEEECKECKRLEEEVKTISCERAAMASEITELQGKIAILDDSNNTVEFELRKENIQLHEKVKELTEESIQLQMEMADGRKQMEKTEESFLVMKEEVERLRWQKNEWMRRKQNEGEMKREEKQSVSEHSLVEKSASSGGKENDYNDLKQDVKRLRKERDEWKAEAESEKCKNISISQDFDKLRAEMGTLKKEKEEHREECKKVVERVSLREQVVEGMLKVAENEKELRAAEMRKLRERIAFLERPPVDQAHHRQFHDPRPPMHPHGFHEQQQQHPQHGDFHRGPPIHMRQQQPPHSPFMRGPPHQPPPHEERWGNERWRDGRDGNHGHYR